MRKRDIPTIQDMNMQLFKNALGKSAPASLWIDEDSDTIYVNFRGSIGGIVHYISDGEGLLLSMDDEELVVVGLFFGGFLKRLKESDDEEMALRKVRYFPGEKE